MERKAGKGERMNWRQGDVEDRSGGGAGGDEVHGYSEGNMQKVLWVAMVCYFDFSLHFL